MTEYNKAVEQFMEAVELYSTIQDNNPTKELFANEVCRTVDVLNKISVENGMWEIDAKDYL